MDQKKQTLIGVRWSFMATSGEQVVTFLVLMVLARLLSPEEFGTVALASLFVLVLQGIVKNTFNQALAQRPDAEPEHFDASFWIAVAIGLCGSGIIILSAGAIARLFNTPLLEELVPWLCAVLLLSSLATVQESWLMRDLHFRPLAISTVTAAACGGVAGIALAFSGHSVWSLVAQQIVSAAVNLIIVSRSCDWRPRLAFSKRHAKEIMAFGRYVMGNNAITMLSARIDVAVTGFFLGPAALAFYNVGQRFLQMLLGTVLGSFVRVFLPTFSRIHERNPERFPGAFATTLSLTSFVTFPIFIGLACVADDAVVVLLGDKWSKAAPVVGLLALAGVILSINWINATTLVALGKPQWHLVLTIIQACLRLAAFLIAVQWGIVAVAAAFTLVACLVGPLYIWIILRLTQIHLQTYVHSLWPTFAASTMMAAVLFTLKGFMDGVLTPFASLPIQIGLGATAYLGAVFLFSPSLAQKAFDAAREAMSRQRTADSTPGHAG